MWIDLATIYADNTVFSFPDAPATRAGHWFNLYCMNAYRPIACETYAELELAILRRKALRIGWRDSDGRRHLAALWPRNLVTRNHEEYLVAEDTGGSRLEIRLDRIIQFGPINPRQD